MATAMQSAYKQNAMKTASPGELTLMLYNGCLKFIKQTRLAMEENDLEKRNLNSTKAQNIIRELMVTLKTDNEVGQNMMRMYDFILNRLIEANVKNDANALTEAEGLVVEFRDTWKEVIQLDRKQRHGAGGKA
ncbi:flagellar export chaperone FliS [Alkalihalophilus marmarensis]|jgi:flagellar protein FliS|uniref:Flagellar secretion chaperone FliS n=1 Tax=Alkalihalophilus marmarensis DSM 21297 TaxID=1188261 RepID=U6SNB1_9BACI|nr:flagellar export chaperone FliS [Alkalihalophilus marmarensis]ERN52131.1 flagellar biosynthesis protein FliS [Alkalihalophilus marmarensis DSM 21297]